MRRGEGGRGEQERGMVLCAMGHVAGVFVWCVVWVVSGMDWLLRGGVGEAVPQ